MHLPIIDLDLFRANDETKPEVVAECKKAAEALTLYGALLLRDSRVAESDNNAFLDLLEDYFVQPEELLKEDERPQLSFQVGVTLENTEKPKCAVDQQCLRIIQRLQPSERPLDVLGHDPDPKCRFFWSMSEKPPYDTMYPSLNAPNVVPSAPQIREQWEPIMSRWGKSMKTAVEGIAEMAAIGFGLPRSTFKDAGQYGPHLLAPTASDLRKYGKENTILAGFHTDLNFLTIHGRSRYPGLHIWARNTGQRIPVKMPSENLLLVQAGLQLEHITGGLVKAGFHEVVVNSDTIKTLEARKVSNPGRPTIRISSTFFWHLSSDYDLVPIPSLAAEHKNLCKDDREDMIYEPMKVGQQVSNELKHIELMA